MKAYILIDEILLIPLGSENVVTSCILSKKELEGGLSGMTAWPQREDLFTLTFGEILE